MLFSCFCKKEDTKNIHILDEKNTLVWTCSICMEDVIIEDKITLKGCNHNVCVHCLYIMMIYREQHLWCNWCPLCRTKLTREDDELIILKHKQYSPDFVNKRLMIIIQKMKTKDPYIRVAYELVASSSCINEDEKTKQLEALYNFYEGKINYGRMRELAG